MKRKENSTTSKERLSVLWVWSVLLGDAPERVGVYKSPFRPDRTPSLSIFADGTAWHDFGTGDGGDAYDFAALAMGKDVKRDFRAIKEALGQETPRLSAAKFVTSAPPANPIIASTDQMQGIINSATNGLIDTESETWKLMTNKRLSPSVIRKLISEASFGSMGPWPVFIYDDGVKIRFDHQSSRSSRWMVGSANGRPWRERALHSFAGYEDISTVIVFEGETDLMWAMSCHDEGLGVAYIAAPSAGWRPSPEWLDLNLTARRVVTAFDYDDAGRKATKWWNKEVGSEFIDWRKTSLKEGEDFSKLPPEEVKKILSKIKTI